LLLVVPFRFIHIALSPLVSVMTAVSNSLLKLTGGQSFKGHLFGNRAELRLAMQESHNLTSEERGMINRVLDLQNRTVGTVTVPLNKVVGIGIEAPCGELIALSRQNQFTRLPVWRIEGGQRRIVGVVSLKNLLYSADFDPTKPVGAYLRSALYLREDLRLEETLRRMQRSGQRLAIVLGLDQRELGIVSLQDILRTVFGEVSL
jgi:putative hemolysin